MDRLLDQPSGGEGGASLEWEWNTSPLVTAGGIAAAIIADDITGVGVADDPVALAVIIGGAAATLGVSIYDNWDWVTVKSSDALNTVKSWFAGSNQDKKLSPGEIKRLERGTGESAEEIKGGKHTGSRDLYKDKNGNIIIKPKGGKGPGEPTGYNINDY